MARTLGVVVILLLLPVGIWFWMSYCSSRLVDQDYSTEDPAAVFLEITGINLPKGFDEVKVAGHRGVQSGQVWMKLHGTVWALHAITAKSEPLFGKFTYTIPNGTFGVDKIFHDDATAAGWDEVQTLNKPDYFIFQNQSGTTRWAGTIVISGSTHTAYVEANQE